MKIKIQLPTDKEGAVFILELLRRLNINFELEDNHDSDELNMLLKERIADMEANPNDVIRWGDTPQSQS
jgi:hypothetical protein